MAQNPKYDNDMVNLGYLNKRLGQTEESISKNNNSISQLPKNYSTPPNPPYYKDSLLCYGNKIYRCNITKLRGEFSWNDWTIVATDDTTISDFIKNTYEVEKLEIQEQIDGKVQTHYQDNDPSKDWATDLEKGRHVGDYWYNTTNDTQWRYNQITTGPTITYGWGQVNIPKSVFDTIDRKKSIYTEKPTSYKKDDLWIIEETLSDDDLPIGTDENPIAKGDWVFSIADSDVYNKSHWVKRDEDVPLSYLKQHYYTITEIDSSLEVIERNTESKITKASEEISLNVSQTYTTKEEHVSAINDFDEQIGTINHTITEHKETLSDLSVEVGEISASVETVETKTEELTVDVNGVKENIIPTATVTGPSIKVEDASNNPLINLEIEGKSVQNGTPAPDTPVEIQTVGYHNEFDSERWYETLRAKREQSMMKETVNGIEYYKFLPHTIYNVEWNVGEFKENTQYTLSFKGLKYIASNPTATGFSFDYTDGTFDYVAISSETEQEYYLTSKPGKTIKYIGLYYAYGYYALVRDIQIVEGTTVHDYIPYDKYGVKIKTAGKNLLDIDNSTIAYLTKNSDGSFTSNINNGYYASISCTAELRELFINSLGKTFTFSVENNYGYYISIVILGTRSNGSVYQEANNVGNSVTITIADDFTSISDIQLRPLRDTSPYTNTTNVIRNLQLEENKVATEYNKFERNELLAVLNQPLRSLPNGVKDIAYIKNNKLYVDRYVGSVVLDGSEEWTMNNGGLSECANKYFICNNTTNISFRDSKVLSNYFENKSIYSSDVIGIMYEGSNTSHSIRIRTNKTSIDEFKTWLSTHNTQVDYELAEPYTEELGEIQILKTLKGYNNISTTDNLLPIINLTYVRDTILADYVENHVAELKITEGEIKESVEKVSTSVDGLNSTVNRVEEITTDNSQVINIITTNIDRNSGEVREVTTTTGFTFNKDGMTIDNGSGFKAEHRANGTYYKDGESIVGEYTKDGSKQKDLSLFGTYSYAMNDKDATPMFVGQLFTNTNGEEGFGHFYNGGDY